MASRARPRPEGIALESARRRREGRGLSTPLKKIAYLYSRYPVVSQTFCDSEMLALEALGHELVVGSLNPPTGTFRHERYRALKAPVYYPPPPEVLNAHAESDDLRLLCKPVVERHLAEYGASFKPEVRARNAMYFGRLFKPLGVEHVHVHFANRATHTALFLKEMGLPFSFTAHAQDFMVDLGSDELLRELCRQAEFVVAVSDYSKGLLQKTCPDSAEKIVRIYNGMRPGDFPAAAPGSDPEGVFRIVSVGRFIEFKGFHHLVAACGLLRDRGVRFRCEILGDGPWRGRLEAQVAELGLGEWVRMPGVRSQEEVKAALAQADVFALPCITDSKGASDILPTVITEAMACRLPVVSTGMVGVPEMVVDGVTGLLVEPGDEEGFAGALAELAADPARAREFGEAGRARMEQVFDQEKTSRQLAERFQGKRRDGFYGRVRKEPAPGMMVLAGDGSAVDPAEMRGYAAAARAGVLCVVPPEPVPPNDGEGRITYFPDAMVVEAAWLFGPEARARCEVLRGEPGISAVPGEIFFTAARRAVYLVEMLRKRPEVVQLHAARAADVVAVWLAKKLEPRLRASYAVEENPGVPRAALVRMLADFEAGSVSDRKLAGMLGIEADDALKLALPPSHRRIRFGPFRFRVRNRAPEVDREWLARGLLDKLGAPRE